MLKLEDIVVGAEVIGLTSEGVARVVSVEWMGADALVVSYRSADGRSSEQMVYRIDEEQLKLAEGLRSWAYTADGDAFKLAVEAYRIQWAHLFDPMMAVHTSNVEPLPHQITAVYETMLERQPLRFVLADDPGAGKTIMAGLLIRELIMRADARRVLIVAPGSLVEQWQDEMLEKFGLSFRQFSRELVEQSGTGNPFEEHDLLIARVDMLARAEDLQEKLGRTQWDLIIVDEAHKLSASYGSRDKIKKTKRFSLGETLASITRHFLLMTATPHNGKEEEFQLFLSLIDKERFYGKFREGAQQVDVSDVMRRMVKEDMLRFDGTRLFPERRAYTVNYQLSDLEHELYEAVTSYVKMEFDRADQLTDKVRKGTVGFALTSLQRRLASSPEAIYQSLKRRRTKLMNAADEERRGHHTSVWNSASGVDKSVSLENIWDADDDLSSEEYEHVEEQLVDQATAARTAQELDAEVKELEKLEEMARAVVASGRDRKWDELSSLLQDTPEMRDEFGHQRKLIIFTEHRDTLNYLQDKITGLLGDASAVGVIHGAVKREDRRRVQEMFRNEPALKVLVATDAAGEGVNLQNANLMVNYDLPWNPNRLEQRFGRIHRIGQTEVCHLWNLVAAETREGDVFSRLFAKLEVEREALGGKVFDILGEVFENRQLKELLVEAIRYGENPATRAKLTEAVEGALDSENLRKILERNALGTEVMDTARLFAVKEEMDKAEARKLQPYFLRAFFEHAFGALGGKMWEREAGRYEITRVPAKIREFDRARRGADRRDLSIVTDKYIRICFDKEGVRLRDRVGAPMASLVHSGHPLMQALTGVVLEDYREKLKQGAVLVDRNDLGKDPRALFIIDHAVREKANPDVVVSRRLQFVTIDEAKNQLNAGYAPHLDLDLITDAQRALVSDFIHAAWLGEDLEKSAIAYAGVHLGREHYEEVAGRVKRNADRIEKAVYERLVKEIAFQQKKEAEYKAQLASGRDVRLTLEQTSRTIDDLNARLAARRKELAAMREVASSRPTVLGGALIIPQGLLDHLAIPDVPEPQWSADAAARSRIEWMAMNAVMDAERALGNDVRDVSAQKCGWDITAMPPSVGGSVPDSRHIEVKGRVKGSTTVTVTRQEVMSALNQGEKFILALVFVDGDQVEGPYYIRGAFEKELGWAEVSVNLEIAKLMEKATAPC